MRVLFVGLGSIADKHIAALCQIDANVEIFALRSRRGAEFRKGIINLYEWSQVGDIHFDFAVISNPTSEHVTTIRQLLPHRMPLFIEKPVSSEVLDETLITEIKNAGIITYIGCNLRFHGCIREASRLIQKHRVNEVNVYCGSYLPDWRPQVNFRTVYSAIPELGGGVHIDLIHEMDYVYWLFGKPQCTHKIFSCKSSLDIRSFDYANYLMEYPCHNVNIVLNYYRCDYKRTMELVCNDATFLVNLATNTITFGDKVIYSSPLQIQDTYLPQMEYFVECVRNNCRTINDIEDANNVLKISLQNDIER